jgi:hypothetical protein
MKLEHALESEVADADPPEERETLPVLVTIDNITIIW